MADRPRIRLERHHDDKVALLVIDRPEVHNALDRPAMEAFARAVDDLGRDGKLMAVVVTGAGEKAFVAGGDLKDLGAVTTHLGALALADLMGDALERLSALPVPVLAAVNGHAYGGGCDVALACDYRIVDEGAHFAFKAVRLGVMDGWGGTTRLVRLVGRSHALRLLLTGEEIGAAAAAEYGLADEVVPAGTARTRALALAAELAAGAPLAVRATKEALARVEDLGFHDALALEKRLFAETWASEDHGEALAALREGRDPDWKGR